MCPWVLNLWGSGDGIALPACQKLVAPAAGYRLCTSKSSHHLCEHAWLGHTCVSASLCCKGSHLQPLTPTCNPVLPGCHCLLSCRQDAGTPLGVCYDCDRAKPSDLQHQPHHATLPCLESVAVLQARCHCISRLLPKQKQHSGFSWPQPYQQLLVPM